MTHPQIFNQPERFNVLHGYVEHWALGVFLVTASFKNNCKYAMCASSFSSLLKILIWILHKLLNV